MDKITTIKSLILTYYDVCDNWTKYLPSGGSPTQICNYRANIVNTIYIVIYGKMPQENNTFTLLRLLNNDIIKNRLSPDQIINRLKIKNQAHTH